jgi:hypothetical protein
MFSKIEKLVDGNAKLVIEKLADSLGSIFPSVSRKVGNRLANQILQLHDVVQGHVKAVNFSSSNLSSMCNSTSVSVQAVSKQLNKLKVAVQDLSTGVTHPSKVKGVKAHLEKLKEGLSSQLKAANDLVIAHMISRPECDLAKVIQAVQALDAKIHRLELALETWPKQPMDSGQAVAKAIEATMAKVMTCLDNLLEGKGGLPPATAAFQEEIVASVVKALKADMPKVEPGPQVQSVDQRMGESLQALQESLEARIEEASEGQRRDSLKLNECLDTLLDQHCTSNGWLQVQLSDMALGIKLIRLQEPPRPLQAATAEVAQDNDLKPISVEEQKQLTNAIARSDWPTFSGKGEYDQMDFIHWINSAQ